MNREFEQACMDILFEEGQDPIDLLLAMPKPHGRVWKSLFDMRDLDGHVATTNKEIGEHLNVDKANISRSISWLVKNEHIQREGIHFHVNPYNWWYGLPVRKLKAREEWDKRKLEKHEIRD